MFLIALLLEPTILPCHKVKVKPHYIQQASLQLITAALLYSMYLFQDTLPRMETLTFNLHIRLNNTQHFLQWITKHPQPTEILCH